MKPEYDVFISFKHLDSDGVPTRDSHLAEEVFYHLNSRGFKVFFSKVSLELMGADAYKRAIDDALDASTVLIAVGTSRENLESRWVQYEWDSFLQEILSGRKKNGRVFTYVDARSQWLLPYALRSLTVFRHGVDPLEKLSNYVGPHKAEEQRLAREAAAREAEEQRRAREAAAREAEEQRRAREAAAREAEEQRRAREAAAREAEQQRLAKEAAALEEQEQAARLMVQSAAAQMTADEVVAFEAHLREVEENWPDGELAELARATRAALARKTESDAGGLEHEIAESNDAVGRLLFELSEAMERKQAAAKREALYQAKAVGGRASVAHPHADPNGAARRNIEYREALARWKALPRLQRMVTKKPPLPPGMLG
jgi:chemotaxis protein histidine kinase CheA